MKVNINDEVLINGRRCGQLALHFRQKSMKAAFYFIHLTTGSYLTRISGTCRRCLLPLDFNPSSEHGNSVSELSAPASYNGLYKFFSVVVLKDEKDVSISSSLLIGVEAA